MSSLKSGKQIYSDGLRFVYLQRGGMNLVQVFNAEKTQNQIDSYCIDTLNTDQDFEMEVSFWLHDNGVI